MARLRPMHRYLLIGISIALLSSQARRFSPIYPAISWVPPPLPTLESGDARLEGALHIGEGDLVGPESMVASRVTDSDGRLVMFAGLVDGRIVRIRVPPGEVGNEEAEEWTTVLRTGEAVEGCGDYEHQPICGRPLGLRLVGGEGPDGEVLYVVDAYKGLLRVDGIHSSSPHVTVLTDVDGDGNRLVLPNDLVVAGDGTIYFTETTDEFQVNRIFYAAFAGRERGRLMALRPSGEDGIRRVETLASGIFMANGLEMTHDGTGLLVVSGAEVLRYDLASGEIKLFAPLVGTGDNIRRYTKTPSGAEVPCYWLGLGTRYSKPFSFFHFTADRPALREILMLVLPYAWVPEVVPPHGIVAAVDEHGELVEVLQDATGATPWVSEAQPIGDWVYLGSWTNRYIARVPRAALAEQQTGDDVAEL